MRNYYKNLTGLKFGKLTVVKFTRSVNKRSLWLVTCECGSEREIQGRSLTSGNTKSCGCSHREFMKQAMGTSSGRLTGAKWCAIKYNAGVRGHKILITQERAAELFEQQEGLCALSGEKLVLDAPRGEITASLDRIDSSKDYEVGNVQWIHKIINKMKNDLSESEFLDWIEKIHQFKIR